MNSTAVLVSCSKTKSDERCAAYRMYQSVYFEKMWTTANLIGIPYIISGKHGLLFPSDRIDPYEKNLNDADKEERVEWAHDVISDLPDEFENIVLFAPKKYRHPIEEVIEKTDNEYDVYCPFEAHSGNGEQMGWLDEVRPPLRSGASYHDIKP